MAAEKKAQEDAKVPQEYKIVAAKDAAMRAEFKTENERVRSVAAQYNKAKQEARAREQAKKDAAIQKQTERVAIAQARQVARTAAAANIAQPLISGVAVFSAAAIAYNAMSPSGLGPKIIGSSKQKKKKTDMSKVKADAKNAKKIVGDAWKERDGRKVVDGFVDFLLDESRGNAGDQQAQAPFSSTISASPPGPNKAPTKTKQADLFSKAQGVVDKFSEKKGAEDLMAKAQDMVAKFSNKKDAEDILAKAQGVFDKFSEKKGAEDLMAKAQDMVAKFSNKKDAEDFLAKAQDVVAKFSKKKDAEDLLSKAEDMVTKFSKKKDAEDAAAAATTGQEAPSIKGPNQLAAEAKAREAAAAVPPPAPSSPPVAPVIPAVPAAPAAPVAPLQAAPPPPTQVVTPPQPVQNVPAQGGFQKSYFPGSSSGDPPPGKKAGPGSYLDNL